MFPHKPSPSPSALPTVVSTSILKSHVAAGGADDWAELCLAFFLRVYLHEDLFGVSTQTRSGLGVLSNCVYFESLSRVPSIGWVAFSAWLLEHSVALSPSVYPSLLPCTPSLPPVYLPFPPCAGGAGLGWRQP